MRFEVFNLELGEGLAESYATGLDVDPFDEFCDHLIVEEAATGTIVGTYRLQTGQLAAANLGYYSEREFDFAPYESFRCEMIELGRACVHADHRNFNLLHLLWRGIARYAIDRKARFWSDVARSLRRMSWKASRHMRSFGRISSSPRFAHNRGRNLL